MQVTILPYISDNNAVQQKQTAKKAVSSSHPVKSRTGSDLRRMDTETAVSEFSKYLEKAERTQRALAVDALLTAAGSGTLPADIVQKLLSTYTPADTQTAASDTNAETSALSGSQGSTSSVSGATSSDSISAPEDLETYFKEASETYHVDVNLLKAIAKVESNFNPKATSSAGAMGVMQLMPSTAKGLGMRDAYDAHDNIMGGAKIISQNLKKYNGDLSLALAAYNAGSGNVDKYGGIPPFTETQNYVKKVLGYYQE